MGVPRAARVSGADWRGLRSQTQGAGRVRESGGAAPRPAVAVCNRTSFAQRLAARGLFLRGTTRSQLESLETLPCTSEIRAGGL